MKAASLRGLIPLALAGTMVSSYSAHHTFLYNDIAENNIQMNDEKLLGHLDGGIQSNYSTMLTKIKFYNYYNDWIDAQLFNSSPNEITKDENFQSIVELGLIAVPFILEELENRPSYLVWALNNIYGFRISDDSFTTIPEAAKKWIKFLKA